MATDEGEVDYWKSEVIAFSNRRFLFLIILRCRFQGEGQGEKKEHKIINMLLKYKFQ